MRKELYNIQWRLCGLTRSYAVSNDGLVGSVCSAYAFYIIKKASRLNLLIASPDQNFETLCEVFTISAEEQFVEKDIVDLVINKLASFYSNSKIDLAKIFLILDKYSQKDLKEYIIDSIYSFQNKGDDWITNEKINQIAVKLLSREDEYQVLDIGCGAGSFLSSIAFEGRPMLTGYEIDEALYLLAKIRLNVLGVQNNIVLQDVIKNPTIKGTYQAIFCQPPFDLRFDKYYYDYLNSSKSSFFTLSARSSSEWLFIDKVCNSLTSDGKAVVVVTASLLSKQTDEPFRRALLEKGLVEGVIVLPDGILEPYTSLRAAMLVLSNKNNKEVILYDYNAKNTRKTPFNVEHLLKEYVDAMSVSVEDCIKNGLNPASFLKDDLISNIDCPKQLSEVIDGLFPSSQMVSTKFDYCENGNAKILTSLNIIDGQIDLDALPLANVDLEKFDKYVLKENDVLMTTKSTKVKIAVAKNIGEIPIIPIGGMIMIRCKDKVLDPYYLKIFLESVTGQDLLRSIQTGSVIVNINLGNLKSLNVACPDIKKQMIVREKYLSKIDELNKIKNELNKITDELSKIYDASK